MTSKNKSSKYASLKTDLLASSLLGTIAGSFASVTLANLGLLGKIFFGITLTAWLVIIGFILICSFVILFGRFLGKFFPIIYNFVKFGEAGGQNWLVDMGIVNLLIIITGTSAGIYFAIYKAISFLFASTNSYFWNKLWVFYGERKQKEGRALLKFIIATCLGMLLNVILASLINYFGPSIITNISSAIWANMATICGSLFAMLFNFILYKVWVFNPDK